MAIGLLFTSICLALIVSGVAFYIGNFALLTWLCIYVTAVSLGLFVAALRGTHGTESDLDEA